MDDKGRMKGMRKINSVFTGLALLSACRSGLDIFLSVGNVKGRVHRPKHKSVKDLKMRISPLF